MSLHTPTSSPSWTPTKDTGQSSLTRTPACLQLSTVPSEDTVSCNFPLAWSVPKTSSRGALRWNMISAYEISCRLPANTTWCSTHRKHMKAPAINFFGSLYDANGVHPDPEKVDAIHALMLPTNITELPRVLRPSHVPKSLHPWFVHLDCPSVRATQEGHRLHLEPFLQCHFSAGQISCCQ